MAKEIIEIDVKTNVSGEGAKSLADLKKEFKDLQNELSGLEQGSQEYISTLKRLGAVKDDIGDLRSEIEGFAGADAKFKAIGNVMSGVASGFAAAQGAAALFGAESEQVQQAILKVQAAMALAQGIEGIIAMGDSFKVLKNIATDTLKAIKNGIAATGIGLFIVALGTVVAYWDDIKTALGGVSEAQKDLNKLTDENLQKEKDKLTELNSQDNVLKLQGLSEKEILNLKIKQTDEVIAATQEQIRQKQITSKLEIEAAERNANITKQIIRGSMEVSTVALRLLAAPIDAVLATANAISEKLGFGQITAINLNAKISELNEFVGKSVGDLLFDPTQTKLDAEKTLAESDKALKELINQRAGLQLQIKAIDKQANDEAKKKADTEWEEAQKEAERLAEIEFQRNEKRRQRELEEEARIKETLKQLRDQQIAEQIKANQEEEARLLKLAEGYKQLELQKVEWAKQGLNLISELNTTFAGKSEAAQRRAFEIDKGVKLASATISGIEGTINAYKTAQASPITAVFPAYPVIQAGLAAAFAAVNVAKIAKTKFGGTEKAEAPQGGGNLGTFTQGTGGTQAPGLTSQNTVTQLNPDGTVAGQGQRQAAPMKAYVVESESRAVTERVNKLSNQSKIG